MCGEFLRAIFVLENRQDEALRKWALHAAYTLSSVADLIDRSKVLARRFFGYCFVGLDVDIWKMEYANTIKPSHIAIPSRVPMSKSSNSIDIPNAQPIFRARHIAHLTLANATSLETFVEWHVRILEWAAITLLSGLSAVFGPVQT